MTNFGLFTTCYIQSKAAEALIADQLKPYVCQTARQAKFDDITHAPRPALLLEAKYSRRSAVIFTSIWGANFLLAQAGSGASLILPRRGVSFIWSGIATSRHEANPRRITWFGIPVRRSRATPCLDNLEYGTTSGR